MELSGAWQRRWRRGDLLARIGGYLGEVEPLAGAFAGRSLEPGRLSVTALPAGVLIGDDYESQRLDGRLGSWPVIAFYERHRLWANGSPRGPWLDLRGLELEWTQAPLPLLRLPAFDLRLGVAEALDPPFAGDIEGWFVLEWKP